MSRSPSSPSVAMVVAALIAACSGDADDRTVDAGAPPRDAARGDGSDVTPSDGGSGDADALDAGAGTDGAPPADTRWLEDVTTASGVAFAREAADGYATIPDRMSGGVCVLDADGGGPLDLFFANRRTSTHASFLYVARAAWSYADETAARGLADVDAIGCLAYDEDGDGDDDLLVTSVGAVRLFANEGGSFVERTERLGLSLDPNDMYTSAAAGDVDGDGDLDVLVGGMLRFDRARHAPDAICGSLRCNVVLDAFEHIPDLLLVRRADGRYDERAAVIAPDLGAREPALCVAVSDLDGDGSADLYVGNDVGYAYRDRALRRDALGTFHDAAEDLGLAYNRRGYGIDTMGWSTGDVDGDARLDHVATSWEGDATAVFVRGEDGRYEDRAFTAGTIALATSFRWGAGLVDLDLDGDLDLVEATGHYHGDDEVRALGLAHGVAQPGNLMENVGGGVFLPVGLATDDGLRTARATRGIAVADLDDDGRPDVVLAPAFGPPAVLRNVRATEGHWLRIALVGRGANRPAAGALVTIRAADRTLVRERRVGEGFLGSFDPRLLVGLAAADAVEVEVRWPSGATSRLVGVAVDRAITIREP